MTNINSLLSIAPMIDWSYVHFRVFMRLLAPNALLYTEMQTTGAVRNNPLRALNYDPIEHPIALQLGGSDPNALAECTKKAEEAGYDEVNLNLGCPSDKVQAGKFGACLMKEPSKVVACIEAMKKASNTPITAKIRIGIDEQDSYEYFSEFVAQLVHAGINKLIVHARKAWLNGLNPKQNRTIPPVQYDYVYRIKTLYPNLLVIINGSITDIEQTKAHLLNVDGVMLGRLACDNPYKIAQIHHELYPETVLLSRSEMILRYYEYSHKAHQNGAALSLLLKPIFNLAHGLSGASQWKKRLMQMLQNKNMKDLPQLGAFLAEMECNRLLTPSEVCLYS